MRVRTMSEGISNPPHSSLRLRFSKECSFVWLRRHLQSSSGGVDSSPRVRKARERVRVRCCRLPHLTPQKKQKKKEEEDAKAKKKDEDDDDDEEDKKEAERGFFLGCCVSTACGLHSRHPEAHTRRPAAVV